MPGFFSNLFQQAKDNPWTTASIAAPMVMGVGNHIATRWEQRRAMEAEAAAKADAYKEMLQLHPHIKADKTTARIYDSLYRVSPTYAKDPLVAGAMMERVYADSPHGSTSHQGLLGIVQNFGQSERNLPGPAPVPHVWGGPAGVLGRMGEAAGGLIQQMHRGGLDAQTRALQSQYEAKNQQLAEKSRTLKDQAALHNSAKTLFRQEQLELKRQQIADAAERKGLAIDRSLARDQKREYEAQAKAFSATSEQAKRQIQQALDRYQSEANRYRQYNAQYAEYEARMRGARAAEQDQRAGRYNPPPGKGEGEGEKKGSAQLVLRSKLAQREAGSLRGMLRQLRA